MPAAGEILGHYRIEERLGEGAFGAVYRGVDVRLDRKVALKIPHANTDEDPAAWGQLLQEARAASALNHPNICAIYDIGEEAGVNYIALEYVDGRTVADLVRSGPIPIRLAISYAIQIARGLHHAHERGIVHRDLKASNVIVTPEGQAKLLDFGLARRLDPRLIESIAQSRQSLADIHNIAGTLSYMAPEVLRGKPARPTSDLWSLGALLHEMLSGQLPFKGATPFELTMSIMVEAPEPLPSTVPPDVRSLVEKSLQKEPEQRYANCSELLQQLETARVATDGNDTPRSSRMVVAGALALVMAIAAAGFLVRRHYRQRALPPKIEVVQNPSVLKPDSSILPAQPPAANVRSAAAAHSETRSVKPPARKFDGNPNVEVWVNLKTRIYHCPGTRWYQKTADGVLLKQRQAQITGYHAASDKVCE